MVLFEISIEAEFFRSSLGNYIQPKFIAINHITAMENCHDRFIIDSWCQQ